MIRAFQDESKISYTIAMITSDNDLDDEEYFVTYIRSNITGGNIKILIEETNMSLGICSSLRSGSYDLSKLKPVESPEILALLATSVDRAKLNIEIKPIKDMIITELLRQIGDHFQ